MPCSRGWRRNVGLLLLSTLLSGGLTECVLRWVVPASTAFFVHPPRLTRWFRPLPEIMPGVTHAARYTTNSLGLRGRDPDPTAAHEFRILMIGGSTTECLYLDDALNWPALVEQMLTERRSGGPVWVGNAGASGANSRDHVMHAKYLLHGFPRIDMVILLVGINDLTQRLSAGGDYVVNAPVTSREEEAKQIRRAFARAPGRFSDTRTDGMAPLAAPWYKKTATYQLLKRVRQRTESLLASRGLRQDANGSIYGVWREYRRHARIVKHELPDLRPALEEYARNLHLIVDFVEAAGARIVLMTQPTLWRPHLEPEGERRLWLGGEGRFLEVPGAAYYSVAALAEGMAAYNRQLLDVCAARRIDCIDLAAETPATLESFYDDAHFTEQGSRTVARIISDHLTRMASLTVTPTAKSAVMPSSSN